MPQVGEISQGKKIGIKSYIKHIWHACVDCGKERWVQLSKGCPRSSRCKACNSKYLVREGVVRGANNTRWKGGRYLTNYKYVMVWQEPGSFFYSMATSQGYIKEHRLVVAQHLGRCLHSWEIVHHKNHIRDDNRFENLQLVTDDRHKQITIMEQKVKHLEIKVEEQGKLIKLLQWQNKQKEEVKANAGRNHNS